MTGTPRTLPHQDGADAPPVRLAVPRAAPQRRWRPGLVWLAVALVATGGLISWRVLVAVGSSDRFLAVARDVAAGGPLTRADLRVVRITTDPALHPVPADQHDRVIGRHAAVPLVPGTLLTEAQLTDQPVPGPGEQLVGLSLAQDRLPYRRVRAGSRVLLIITVEDSTMDEQPAAGPPVSIPATVVDVAAGDRAGTVLLNLAVSDRDGPLVATRAAAGRIVVVLTRGS